MRATSLSDPSASMQMLHGVRQRRDRPHPDGVQVQLANVLRGLLTQSKGIKLNSKSRGGARATGPASETL